MFLHAPLGVLWLNFDRLGCLYMGMDSRSTYGPTLALGAPKFEELEANQVSVGKSNLLLSFS